MTRRAAVFLLLAVAMSVAGAGSATAFWLGSGGGGGQAVLGQPAALVLSAGTPGSLLYPGGHDRVATIATNPNAYPVHISSLLLDTATGTGGFDVDAPHSSCSVAALSFATQDNGGAGWTIPAKAGAIDGSLAITMLNSLAMASTAADACQGATFTIHLLAGA